MKISEALTIANDPHAYPNDKRRVAYLKLGNAVLRAFPSSPRQRELATERDKLRAYYEVGP